MTTMSPRSMRRDQRRHRALLAVEDARRAAVVAALVAAELDHAALGREVAAQDRQAAGRLDRVVERADDLLALGLGGLACVLADGPAVTVIASSLSRPPSWQALGDQRHAACRVQVGGDVAPAGLEVAGQRRACAMRSKSSMSSCTPASRATASRCSTALVDPPLVATAAIAFSSDARLMISLGSRPR
jgi:hypothetical protein